MIAELTEQRNGINDLDPFLKYVYVVGAENETMYEVIPLGNSPHM